MLTLSPKHKVYLAIQAVDFRMGIDGFAACCRRQFSLDPFNGHYFIFCNRRRTAVKILAYDTQGFWLCHKRLSKGVFRHWPTTPVAVVMLEPLQLQMLLQNANPGTLSLEPPWRTLSD